MNTYEKDKQMIYEAYQRLEGCIKGKKINKSGYADKRMNLIGKTDRVLFANIGFLTPDKERERIIHAGKDTYREYCKFIIGNEEADNLQLRSRMNKMLEKLSGIEAAELLHFRKSVRNGFQIEIDSILTDERWLEEMISEDVVTVIRRAMADGEGINCEANVSSEVTGQTEDPGPQDGKTTATSAGGKPEFATNTAHMTIYVDESARPNPGLFFEPDQPASQNVISYVICNGVVPDEKDISRENILEEGVFQTEDSDNLCYAVFEAFAKLMIKASVRHFTGILTIFTDAAGASEGWRKIRGLNYLADQFEDVRVVKIPREKNTYADKLGRKKAVVLVGKKQLDGKLAELQELDKMKREISFVKEYFPKPQIMIPALLEELKMMAGEEAEYEVC